MLLHRTDYLLLTVPGHEARSPARRCGIMRIEIGIGWISHMSRTFPGLRLAAGAMLKGDVAGVPVGQRRGVRTRRHREFVETDQNLPNHLYGSSAAPIRAQRSCRASQATQRHRNGQRL